MVGQTDSHVIAKISWMDRSPHFLGIGLCSLVHNWGMHGAPLLLILIF